MINKKINFIHEALEYLELLAFALAVQSQLSPQKSISQWQSETENVYKHMKNTQHE